MLVVIKTNKEYRNLKKKRVSRYIYQNELDKACFKNDIYYGDFKYLPRRTAADKVLCDEGFNIARKYYAIKHLILLKFQNMMDINIDLLQSFIMFLIKSLLVVVL